MCKAHVVLSTVTIDVLEKLMYQIVTVFTFYQYPPYALERYINFKLVWNLVYRLYVEIHLCEWEQAFVILDNNNYDKLLTTLMPPISF